jgi:putative salt-induced outer membrane protein
MKKRLVFLGFLGLMILSTGAQAEEKKWSDEAEVSYVDTGGNTETTSLSAKNLLKYTFSEKIEGAWKLAALYAETDGEKTAESYSSELRANYLFTKRLYVAGIVGWEKDEFAGIDNRYYIGPAVGYKFLTGPKHFLLGETGIDYVKEEYTDNTDNDFARGRVYGEYEYAFSEKTKFKETLEYLHDFDDSDNYNINSETSLISSLSDVLSLKTSYEIKYDNKPVPATLDDTDTLLSVTLVINF